MICFWQHIRTNQSHYGLVKEKILKSNLASNGLYEDATGKKKEQVVLQEFLKRLQLGEYQIDNWERPDFILNFSSDIQHVTVGCEITNYFAGKTKRGSRQAQFQNRWKIFARQLRERLDKEEEKFRFYYGAIHFKKSRYDVFKYIDTNALIAEIIGAIKNVDSFAPLVNFDIKEMPLLANHVSHIYLKDTAPETGILWWPAHLQSGSIADPCSRLIKITEEKNAKAKTYNWNGATEKWLLIYAESRGISDMVGLYSDPEIRKHLGDLNFDRVYVWNKYFESIEEIYPEFVTVFDVTAQVLHRNSYPPSIRSFIYDPK